MSEGDVVVAEFDGQLAALAKWMLALEGRLDALELWQVGAQLAQNTDLHSMQRKESHVCSSIQHRKMDNIDLNAVPTRLDESTAEVPNHAATEVADVDEAITFEWRLKKSCWDASMLIGHPSIGLGGSFILLVSLFVNFVLQGTFIFLIATHLTHLEFPDSDIEGFHYFRSLTAHSVHWMDAVSEQALAQRICNNDASLHIGLKQADTVQLVSDYTSQGAGVIMSFAASLVWTLTVLKELHSCKGFLEANLALWDHAKSSKPSSHDSLGRMGKRKKSMLGFILFARVGIALFLLISGVQYLSYTVSLPDLLLNAVALELVLNIDEIGYEAMAHPNVRSFLAKMKPLKLRRYRLWGGVDAMTVYSFVLPSVVLFAGVWLWLIPQVTQLNAAKRELCGGNKDFVFGASPDGWLAWTDVHVDMESIYNTGKYHVMRQLITTDREKYHLTEPWRMNGSLNDFRLNSAVFGFLSVQSLANGDLHMAGTTFNHFCFDIDKNDSFHTRWLGAVRDATGNQMVNKCSEVSEYCALSTKVGVRVRQACPEACGCHTLTSSLFPSGVLSGCSEGCAARHPQYKRDLEAAECLDVVTGDPRLVDYVKGIEMFYQSISTVAWIALESARQFRKRGCSAREEIMDSLQWDWCLADKWPVGVKSIAFLCPVTCKCSTAKFSECPLSCFS